MIYVTGDCHGEFLKFGNKQFYEQKEMTKKDYVIICGDFGAVWERDEESKAEKYWLDWLEERPFTTLFVDGNHENFDRLYSYPIEQWNGGKIHRIRPSVIHLMRGQVFELEGKKIFTFGGASSHDMDGGILDIEDPDYKRKKKELDREWRTYRVKHVSWWEQELPTEEELEEGRRNLENHDYKVDFVITHCHSSSIQQQVGSNHRADILTDYFEELHQKLEYERWYFGHYHQEKAVTKKDIVVYKSIIRIC